MLPESYSRSGWTQGFRTRTAVVLSQKSQYAVRAVLELAKYYGLGPLPAARIAEAQHIPVRFLENILGQLRQGGLVESVRGKDGGYKLGRAPEEVAVGDVIRLIQGPMETVDCTDMLAGGGRDCPLRSGCVLLPLWERAHQAMMQVYDGTTFRELVEQERAKAACEVLDYVI